MVQGAGFVFVAFLGMGLACMGRAPEPPSAFDLAAVADPPVLVFIQADWSMTSKPMEELLETVVVKEALEDGGVSVVRGDLTRRDPVLQGWMEGYGAVSPPVFVLIADDGSSAVMTTPSADELAQAVEALAAPGAGGG